jgi:plastocyanin
VQPYTRASAVSPEGRKVGRLKTSVAGTLLPLVLGLTQPATPAQAQTGVIEGAVLKEAPPRRRSTGRYPGGATGAAAEQTIPVVVFLEGTVGGAPPQPSSVEMLQRDRAFVPAAVVIPVGGAVEFPNGDPFFHNVFSYSSTQRFDLGRYPQGESKSVRFDEAGVVSVFCEVHDQMRAVIVVVTNPFHAILDDGGGFRLDNVPAGDYTLVVWSTDHEPVERPVSVSAGQTTAVRIELTR